MEDLLTKINRLKNEIQIHTELKEQALKRDDKDDAKKYQTRIDTLRKQLARIDR